MFTKEYFKYLAKFWLIYMILCYILDLCFKSPIFNFNIIVNTFWYLIVWVTLDYISYIIDKKWKNKDE